MAERSSVPGTTADRSVAFATASARAGLSIPITWVAEVGSTNAVLKRAVGQGVPHGTALVAGRQLAGRGRLGRVWLAGEGNLYLSVVLRPELPLARVPLLCLATAVALAEVCRSLGAHCVIKWPNDVISAEGRKLAGILAEAELKGRQLDAVVMGVGINVAHAPADAPNAGCLADLVDQRPDLAGLAAELVAAMLRLTTLVERDPAALLDAWRGLQNTLGHRVRVGELEGVAQDIGADGGLQIVDDNGVQHRILAGDVQMVAGL